MEVWSSVRADVSVYIDVDGTPHRGYRITRQTIRSDSEAETHWLLTPTQSNQLRTALGRSITSDALEPAPEARPTFDRDLEEAIAALTPPCRSFTHRTFD